MSQWPRAQAAICSGRAWSTGRKQNRVDNLDLLLALDGAGASDPGSPVRRRGSRPGRGAWTTLRVRRTRRPWEPSGAEMVGTSFQGRSLSVWCRPGWLSLTVNR